MCGINGIFSLSEINSIDKRVEKMNSCLKHRGPDAFGISYIDSKKAFGHTRLSIIDLDSRANQPMWSNSKNTAITYNGEIFNFLELKKELENSYNFVTNCDTEVLLAAYEVKGLKWMLQNINGMFAFAIYNLNSKLLHIVRDRFSIKPLFYSFHNNTLIFSSEVKGILNSGLIEPEFNECCVDEYLANRHIREPYTFFKNIFQVPAATVLTFSDSLEITKEKYWQLPSLNLDDCSKDNEQKIVEQTGFKLEKAIKRWLIADVKTGAYLSGGLDSSLLTAVMAKHLDKQIDTYTIGFGEKGYNEFEYSKIVAKAYNTNHREILMDCKNYCQEWDKLIAYKDAPLAVPNEIPLAVMSSRLSEDITVVISGEGADELFGGYGRIFRSAFDYKNHFSNEKDFYSYFIDLYDYVPRSLRNEYLATPFNIRDEFDQFISSDFSNHKNEENIFRFFHNYHVKSLLSRADMATMQTSVEARVPFMDHKLVEFVYKHVPYSMKLKWKSVDNMRKARSIYSSDYSENLDIPKYVLKKVSEKYLSNDIIYRKKIGFPVPLTDWFKNLSSLADETLNNCSWLKENVLEKLKSDMAHCSRSGQILWMFINIEKFRKLYFNKKWSW